MSSPSSFNSAVMSGLSSRLPLSGPSEITRCNMSSCSKYLNFALVNGIPPYRKARGAAHRAHLCSSESPDSERVRIVWQICQNFRRSCPTGVSLPAKRTARACPSLYAEGGRFSTQKPSRYRSAGACPPRTSGRPQHGEGQALALREGRRFFSPYSGGLSPRR